MTPDFPVSQNIYARLLRAYPAAHRAEYGAAMAQLFRDQCRDAWREAGGWGLAKLWLRVLPDWASTSVRERIAALNERKTMNDKLASLSRDRTTPRAIFIRVAVTVFLITCIIATAVTFILPESYASTCRIKVDQDQPDVLGATNSAYGYDPYFFQTTFEIISSQLVLSNVIATLDLNFKWGVKYFNGERLKTSETMEVLKGRLVLSPVRSTKLIAITVYSDDKNEAALIANAVAESYKNYRVNVRREQLVGVLKVLQAESPAVSNQLTSAQKKVDELRKSLDVHDDISSPGPTPTIDSEQMKKYHDEMLEGERTYQEQMVQLQMLQAIGATNAPMLRDVLPTMTADGALANLLTQYREAQRNLISKRVDFGTNHAEVLREQKLIAQLDQQINDQVAGTMAGLQAQVSSKQASLDFMRKKMEEAKLNDQASAAKTQPYYDAKEKLMEWKRANELLNVNIRQASLDIKIPQTQMAQVTDPAEPSHTPVRPNKTLDIVMGAVGGIIFGLLAGGMAALVAARRGNRAPKNTPSA